MKTLDQICHFVWRTPLGMLFLGLWYLLFAVIEVFDHQIVLPMIYCFCAGLFAMRSTHLS